MRKVLFMLAALGVASTISAGGGPPAMEASVRIDGLSWLAGTWVDQSATGRSEEHWMRPLGGTMVGMGRTVKGDKTVLYEHLVIVEEQGSLVYIGAPAGQAPTRFTLDPTASSATRASFTNPQHDFPQRITYSREGDRLTAEVSGVVRGKEQSMTFAWTLAK